MNYYRILRILSYTAGEAILSVGEMIQAVGSRKKAVSPYTRI